MMEEYMKKALGLAMVILGAAGSGCVDMAFHNPPFQFCNYGYSWYSGDTCPKGVECQAVDDGRLCIENCPAGTTHVPDYITCPEGEENCSKTQTGVVCSSSVDTCPHNYTQSNTCDNGIKCLTIRQAGGYCIENCRSGYVRTAGNKCPDGRVEDCSMNDSGVICMKLEGCQGDSCQNSGAYCESGYVAVSDTDTEVKKCMDESAYTEEELEEFDLTGNTFLCHDSPKISGRKCRKLIEDDTESSEFPVLAEQICTTAQLNPPAGSLKIHVIDVGNGDAIWIQTPDNHNVLVDGGDGGYMGVVSAGPIVMDYLAGHGFAPGSTFDAVILSHPDSDHYGGFSTIFGNGGYKLKNYIDPMESDTNEFNSEKASYFNWIAQMKGMVEPSNIYMPASDKLEEGEPMPDAFFGGDVTARYVFSRKKLLKYNENTASIIFRLEFAGRTMLFTGDATSAEESEVVQKDVSLIQSNILKVCHHGSSSSSTPDFLKGVFGGISEKDRGAVISSGRRLYSGTRTMRPEVVADIRAYVTTPQNFFSTNAGDDYKESDKDAVRDDNVLIVIEPDGDFYGCYSGVN